MENDAGVRELVELIFGKQATIHEEMVARNSSIPSCLLTKDFSKRMGDVLCLRKRIVSYRWRSFFDVHSRKMLSSHEQYLMCVMVACLYEHECNRNIFDSFISVCALVINLSDETLAKTGVNFLDLNPDIIMVFYRNVLKASDLSTDVGFHRFVEYVRGHKYLSWNRNDLILSDDPTAPDFIEPILDENIMAELNSYVSQEVSNDMKAAMEATGISLTQEVLSTTSVELPTLPNEPDLIARLVTSTKKDIAKTAEKNRRVEAALTFENFNVASHGYLSSNSDSKTNYVAKHQENIARYENIVQAVIRHNHSKNSGDENANNQEEAAGILEHLKNTIKSLIEILNECEEE